MPPPLHREPLRDAPPCGRGLRLHRLLSPAAHVGDARHLQERALAPKLDLKTDRDAWTVAIVQAGTRCHLLPSVLQLGVGSVALVLEGLEVRLSSCHRIRDRARACADREAPPLALGLGSSVLPVARAAPALAACTVRGRVLY